MKSLKPTAVHVVVAGHGVVEEVEVAEEQAEEVGDEAEEVVEDASREGVDPEAGAVHHLLVLSRTAEAGAVAGLEEQAEHLGEEQAEHLGEEREDEGVEQDGEPVPCVEAEVGADLLVSVITFTLNQFIAFIFGLEGH